MQENHYNPSLGEKVREWVARRFHIILISSSIAVASSALALIYALKTKEEQLRAWQKIAEEMSSKVVVATVDGRVALVDKKPLPYEIAKAVVNQFVRETFLFDIQHLFGSLDNAKPASFADFVKHSPLAKQLVQMQCYTDKGKKYILINIFQFYYGLLQNNQLLRIPYSLYYKEPIREGFKFNKDGSFDYKATWNVEVLYLAPSNQFKKAQAQMQIELKGFFKPFEGNPFNPLGIKIDYIKFTPVLAPRL